MSMKSIALATAMILGVAGAAGALCHDNTIRMDLTCLSPTTSCSAQWRVEDN